MRSTLRNLFFTLLVFTSAVSQAVGIARAGEQEQLRMDAGWRFALGNASDPRRDFDHATGYFSYVAKAGYGDGPSALNFDDRAWRQLDLPHDWAVEAPFSPEGTASHGFKAIGRNFPEHSVGWYRKRFAIPATDFGRRINIQFDGVFRAARVWVNGFYTGEHPSGYTGFSYDITDYLNYGGDNVIAVRVDATMEQGWFYEGAGIYRHVWLVKTAPVHVVPNGTFVTTRPEPGAAVARITVSTLVANDGATAEPFDLEHEVFAPDGRKVASQSIRDVSISASGTREIPMDLKVEQPQLWSLTSPTLYRLVTTLRTTRADNARLETTVEGKVAASRTESAVLDRYKTTFGIRTIRFDPDHGFFLNGERVELKGVNVHQDHAGVGVALPDALQAFRLARLKEYGVNAIRCAHNPPAAELLDACDQLGVLVIDENRLMGTNPEQLDELANVIRRDRNHPSVILWSLGNEEWAIEGNITGARIASTMQASARRLDPTRETTVAISGGWGGISTVIDVVGYNYISQSNPDEQHANFPHQSGVGTEETTTQGTRGVYVDDRPHAHLSPQARGDSGGNCEKGWQYYAARPFLAGVFFWTGFDYRGEPTPFGWPAISSQMGLLDTCGFPKDSAFYLKAWWTNLPVLHLFPHWNWPERERQEITLGCYSNDEAVEVLLNGTSLGKQDVPRNGHLEWKVRYAPGTLEARGYRRGQVVETTRVDTTGAAAQLVLTPDRLTIDADGNDVAVVSVSTRDANGRTVPTTANLVHFEIAGGRIIGAGNGDPSSHERDQFGEAIALRPVESWRGRITTAGDAATPAAADALKPLRELGRWLAPLPKDGEVYELSATIAIESDRDEGVAPAGEPRDRSVAVRAKERPDVTRTLYLPSFGTQTSVWLNGRMVAQNVDTTHIGPEVALDPTQLVAGPNQVRLIVTPFPDHRNHIPELDRLGTVRIATSAPHPERSLFNGFCEVIIQSTTQAGSIRLRAMADGLAGAETSIEAKPVMLPAAVP